MFNVIDPLTGWKIDLVIRKQRAWSIAELGRRQTWTLLGVPVRIATAEDVILAKLEWAREGGSTRQLDAMPLWLLRQERYAAAHDLDYAAAHDLDIEAMSPA